MLREEALKLVVRNKRESAAVDVNCQVTENSFLGGLCVHGFVLHLRHLVVFHLHDGLLMFTLICP